MCFAYKVSFKNDLNLSSEINNRDIQIKQHLNSFYLKPEV